VKRRKETLKSRKYRKPLEILRIGSCGGQVLDTINHNLLSLSVIDFIKNICYNKV
jgi:hypothetical protein